MINIICFKYDGFIIIMRIISKWTPNLMVFNMSCQQMEKSASYLLSY